MLMINTPWEKSSLNAVQYFLFKIFRIFKIFKLSLWLTVALLKSDLFKGKSQEASANYEW